MRYTSTGFPQKLLVGVNNSHVTVPSTLNSIYRYNDVLIFIKRAVTGNLFQAPCKFCSVNMRNRKLVMRREADENEVGGSEGSGSHRNSLICSAPARMKANKQTADVDKQRN